MVDDIKEQQSQVPNQLNPVKNVPWQDSMFLFEGQWLPSLDPTLIGPTNFKSITNMRYCDNGVCGINGYESRLTNALSSYPYIKNGIHFKTNRTQDSYVLAHALDGSGNGKIYQNQTAIGSVGDFEGTALWTDVTTNLVGRLSLGPYGTVGYANTEECAIWSGEEAVIGAMFQTTTSAEVNPVDVTNKLNNSRGSRAADSDQRVTIDSTRFFTTLMTTRPISGLKFYVYSANASGSTMSVKYWNGSAYAAVSNLTDNTSVGGKTLAQTGTVTFDSTVATAKLHHYQDRFLYAYQIEVSAGSASVYEITANMPMQKPSNVWDGIYREPIQVQRYDDGDKSYEDYTLHVSESSTVNTPVGLYIGQLAAADYVILMFEEQTSAIRMTMLGSLINNANAQLDATDGVQYWNGSSWANLTFTDGTLDDTGDSSFAKTGIISWATPTDEEKTTLFSTLGYAYRLSVDATLSGSASDDVVIDIINGIPARKDIEVYKFPLVYKNKLMMAGYTKGNQGNRIDYCADNAPDVWNGESSSMDGFQSIYVGGVDELTSGTQLFNRYGSNIFTTLVLFKKNETYLLTGDGPLDYKLYPVSFSIGCPAPLTLTTAEVGVNTESDSERNIVLWISHNGPMMFDGATLKKARGLEKYFDPNDSETVNWSYLAEARGWFDSTYNEWNLLLPTGSSTTLNSWFIFDVIRRKWFSKNVGVNNAVTCGFPVIATTGDQYIYAGSNVGQIYQLETGTSWDGNSIAYSIQPGDIFPSGNRWDITRIRRFKFICKRLSETGASINIIYSKDTNESSGTSIVYTDVTSTLSNSGNAGISFVDVEASMTSSGTAGVSYTSAPTSKLDMSVSSGLKRLIRSTENFNEVGWCHNFKFEFSSSQSAKGFEPIGWGIQWEFVRKDEN